MAVLNGVVMVNAINQNLEADEGMVEAVYQGALPRLRPVLMTAAIASLGLIPMLLATSVGSEVQRPLPVTDGPTVRHKGRSSRNS